ncbi:MAG: ribonuclease III [Clostridia bacterium]|nr:ribonuclease III [Clostridia bacterium]
MTDAPDMKTMSNAALAYLGDSVLELLVRERLVCCGLSTAARLNAAAREYVTAPRQAEAMERILPRLTEEESAIYRRGRNNVHANVPKSATVAQYRAATGMECLFAALYLTGKQARARELFEIAYGEHAK